MVTGELIILTQLSEATLLRVVQGGPLDDDCVGRQIDTPGQCGRAAQHTQQALSKQPLGERAVRAQHTSMMDPDAMLHQFCQLPNQGSGAQTEIEMLI